MTQYAEGHPIAGFGYEEGGFPRDRVIGPYSGTNLEGFGVAYVALASESMAACKTKAAAIADQSKYTQVVLRQRTYFVYDTGEGFMSQSIYGTLYATYAEHTCYLFETNVAEASAGVVDDVEALTTVQARAIERHLLAIMKSVRIVPQRRTHADQ